MVKGNQSPLKCAVIVCGADHLERVTSCRFKENLSPANCIACVGDGEHLEMKIIGCESFKYLKLWFCWGRIQTRIGCRILSFANCIACVGQSKRRDIKMDAEH